MLDFHHLAILREIDRKGSLVEAASALHLTQSALSHAIRKLENQYAVQLWQRSGRRIRLTQAGTYLLTMANKLLPQMEEIDLTLKAFGQGSKGKLRIGMECHPCYEWLMTVVSPFLIQWPQVDLDIVQQFRFNGLEALANHQIDLVISSDPLNVPELAFTPVLNYELKLVVSNDHLWSGTNFIKARALSQAHLITFPVERARLDIFTQFLIPAAIEPASHKTVETIEILLQLVASNRGVCTLPDWLVTKYRHSYPISGVRLGAAGIMKTLYLVYRREDDQKAYLQEFIQLSQNRED